MWGGSKAFGKVADAAAPSDIERAVAAPKTVVFYTAVRSRGASTERLRTHPRHVHTPQDNCGKCAQIAPYVGTLSEVHPDVSFVHVSTSGPLAPAAQAAGYA